MFEKFKFRLIFYTVAYFTLHINSTAQEQSLKFDHISVKEGLSQTSINAIVQDKYGFLWFGTQDGLNRFDGYDFKIFKHDPLDSNSISDSYINCLFKDSKDNIWIGTELGLNKYDYDDEIFIERKHIKGYKNSLDNNSISVIYEAPSELDILWIGTKHGLNSYNTKNKIFTRYSLPNSNILNKRNYIINTIYEAPSEPGILWIGTPVGLLRYDVKKNNFTAFLKNKAKNSLSDNFVNVIFEDKYLNLWIGTSDGLNVYNRKSQQFITYYASSENKLSLRHNNVRAIYEDSHDNLWLGTWGKGISLFDQEKKSFISWTNEPGNPKSISNNFITQIFEDNSGILWFGTQVGGVNKMNPNIKKIRHYYHNPHNTNSLAHNLVHSIMVDNQGILWVGTINGITCINEKTGKYNHFKHNPNDINSLSDNLVRFIHQSKNGMFWIGTKFGGLNKFDPIRKTFKHFKPDRQNPNSIKSIYVRTIFEDNKGILWIGTINGGLSKFDPETELFKNYTHDPNDPLSINDDRVYSIIKGRKNSLWIATGNGIASFDTEKELFTRYLAEPENPEGLSYHLVMSVMEDHHGMIWVATYGGGLNRLDPNTGIFTRYTEKDGLPNNAIYGIIEDDQHKLWLSTNQGISVFNPENKEFKNYSVEDGLQDNEFNSGAYLKDKSGNLYFGGMNGLNRIEPGNIDDNQFIPPIVIHDFQLFNKSVSVSGQAGQGLVLSKTILETDIIKLSYKENSFSFLFAALDYTFPEKNEYMYILENFDEEWTKVKNRRFVTYTSLPAGEYIFKVKGSNSDGVWNEKGRSIILIIKPPFWETWWFRSLIMIFIVSSLVSFYIIRTREIKKRNKELETTVQDRTHEIQEKNDEISAQNEELMQSKEEIEVQRDEIEVQRDRLEKNNEEIKKSYYNVKMLSEIGKNITSTLEHEKVLELVYKHINQLMDATIFGIGEYNEKEQIIEYKLAVENGVKYKPYSRKMIDKNQFPVWCLENKKEVFINNVEDEYSKYLDEFKEYKVILENGNESKKAISLIYLPLIAKEKMMGIITVQSFKRNAYTQNKLNILRNIANYTAIALENAVSYNRIEHQKEEIEIVNEKLRELDQFKEEMTGMIVHDLKNPLNSIIGSAENDTVKQSGKQMLNMVMNILDVQKYEETEIKLKKASFSIYLIAQSALEQVILLYEQKSIKVENYISDYTVIIDADIIERVFVNILTNAIKYTPNNGKIVLKSDKIDGDYIQIKIMDNGPGIPQDRLDKIFLKFEQVVAKESGIARSTGIGLTFCKMVIEAHDCKIGVETKLKKGTSFWFTLPAGQQLDKLIDLENKSVEEKSLELARTDKEILKPYLLKLQNLEVYELSDIELVIDQIDFSKSPNMQNWKKEMDNALYAMNQEKYFELVKMIS